MILLRKEMCKVIYPVNWTTLGPNPQLVLYSPMKGQQLKFAVCEIDEPRCDVLALSEFVENISRDGRFRVINLPNVRKTARYSVQVIDISTRKVIAEIGFAIDESIAETFDLSNSFDSISDIYLNAPNCRFVSNGIGKCGTSWLVGLLASLPGLSSVDMAVNGFHGTSPDDLKKVPEGAVYHGHLNYHSTIVSTLTEYKYCHAYIYRDLRDSIVSEYFHKFHFQKNQHIPSLVTRPESEMFSIDLIYKWSDVVYNAPSAVGWSKSKDCICLSYEDLLLSPVDTFARLIMGLGFKTEVNLIRYILFINRFMLKSGGRKPGETDPNSFFRKGVRGDWVNYINKETSFQLRLRNTDYFQHFGYD
jgi:hypothetical protein